MANATAGEVRRQIKLERTYRATLEEIWELWTTKDGIEAWWGPDGFSVEVHKIDLRPGGKLVYAMNATAPETIAFMKSAGAPTSTMATLTYREIQHHRRLVLENLADFIPGEKPYTVDTIAEFTALGDSVRVELTLDAMHNEEWTGRMVMGWEMELGKLGKLLAARAQGGAR